MSNTSTEQDSKVISTEENNEQLSSTNNDAENKQVSNAEVIWVPINQVMPNPMNPRKDNSVKTENMQEIIKKRGWEEPLTVYKQGKSTYVLLAGHRRLYAAKAAGETQLPVYITPKPKSDQEEIERIASLQSGRVDWTPYEWAQFTYERWISWGRPATTAFAKKIGLGPSKVKQYIEALDNFPRPEIEAGLLSGSLTITGLDALSKWLKLLNDNKPDLIEDMGEDLVRKVMLAKMAKGKVTREDLRATRYIHLATEEDVRTFLREEDMRLSEQLEDLGPNLSERSFPGHLTSMTKMKQRIPNIVPENSQQHKQALANLEDMQKLISEKLQELKGFKFREEEESIED